MLKFVQLREKKKECVCPLRIDNRFVDDRVCFFFWVLKLMLIRDGLRVKRLDSETGGRGSDYYLKSPYRA